jgi:membrane protein DedA with SNARE-associated domain
MIAWFAAPGSYIGIFIVLVLTGSGLPIPEEVPIILAGILSGQQALNPWLAFATCLLGALIGDCVMYVIGYHFGRPVLRDHPWFARFVTPEREIQIEQQFRLHGLKVFFVARFLVGLRSPVYLTAGILRVSFRRFLMIDLFCATMVVGTFFWTTYLLGEAIAKWVKWADVGLTIVVVLALMVVGIYLWWRYGRKMSLANSNPRIDHPENSTPSDSPSSHDQKAVNSAGVSPQADKAAK